jgi:hypothetical protein
MNLRAIHVPQIVLTIGATIFLVLAHLPIPALMPFSPAFAAISAALGGSGTLAASLAPSILTSVARAASDEEATRP